MTRRKLVELPLSLIDRPKDPARRVIDPEKVRELSESIRESGLQEPIVVRPVDARYEVVAGDRRYLAHKLLGKEKIDCIVRVMSDEEMVVARAIENVQREDLSPMDKARVYEGMRKDLGWEVTTIARKMGLSRETVLKYLTLCEMDVEFQEAIDCGKLSISVAYALRKIDDPEFRRFYLKSAVENGATEAVAVLWVGDYEKTRAAKFYEGVGGGGLSGGAPEAQVVYGTCDICQGPEEMEKMRYIRACGSCAMEIRRARYGRVADHGGGVDSGGGGERG